MRCPLSPARDDSLGMTTNVASGRGEGYDRESGARSRCHAVAGLVLRVLSVMRFYAGFFLLLPVFRLVVILIMKSFRCSAEREEEGFCPDEPLEQDSILALTGHFITPHNKFKKIAIDHSLLPTFKTSRKQFITTKAIFH